MSVTMCLGPDINASSTYNMRNAASASCRYRKRQGSLGHCVNPMVFKTLTV